MTIIDNVVTYRPQFLPSTEVARFCTYKHTFPTVGTYYGRTYGFEFTLKELNQNRWCDGEGYSSQQLFYCAIKSHGWENFKHKVCKTHLFDWECSFVELCGVLESMSTGHSYNSQIPKIGIGYYYKDGKNERLSKSLLQTYANGRVVWNKGLSTDDPRVFLIGKKISKALIGKAQPEHLNIRRRNTLLGRYTGCKNAYYYYRKVYYMSDGLQGDANSLAKYYSIKYN